MYKNMYADINSIKCCLATANAYRYKWGTAVVGVWIKKFDLIQSAEDFETYSTVCKFELQLFL